MRPSRMPIPSSAFAKEFPGGYHTSPTPSSPNTKAPVTRTTHGCAIPTTDALGLDQAVHPSFLNAVAASNSATVLSADTSGFTWWSGPQM